MIRSPKSQFSWLSVVLIIVAGALWLYNNGNLNSAPLSKSTASKSPEKTGNYQLIRGCTLVEARNNDGDSFMVRLPDGKKVELRLYFVDTPESAFKTYSQGETNRSRISQQAADMGGITPEQAVLIGQKAKKFTLDLLSNRPFDIFTVWDSPFNDNRYHAFVQVQQDDHLRWLSELLVEQGLARIKTKPADLPDGTPASQQTARLRELERAAKRAEVGVWGL